MPIELIVVVVLAVLGYVFGQLAERRHFASIRRREREYAELLTFSERRPPPGRWQTALVGGNVVVSVDYFKRLAAGLRALIGGRVSVYESLLERARREAILRMKEDALTRNAVMIMCVRLETASITKGKGDQISSVEVYAYGTALMR